MKNSEIYSTIIQNKALTFFNRGKMTEFILFSLSYVASTTKGLVTYD